MIRKIGQDVYKRQLINVFTNLFIGISLGANVLAARFFASGRDKEMSDKVHTAILLALISGILMAGIGAVSYTHLTKEIKWQRQVIRKQGVSQITLEATEMGRPLYEKYGFRCV